MASKREGTLWLDRQKLVDVIGGEAAQTEIVGTYSSGKGPLAVFLQFRKEDGKARRTDKGHFVLVAKRSKDDGGEVEMTIFLDLKTFKGIKDGQLAHTSPVGYAFRAGEEGNGRTLFAMTKKMDDGTYKPVLSNVEGKSRKYGFNLRGRSQGNGNEAAGL
jgi:hypothetical protein